MSKIYYSPSHEYIKVDGNIGVIGITDYAQHQLGNVVYVDLPEEDNEVTSGKVIEVNFALVDEPGLINKNAMDTWIIKVELSDPSELDSLLDEEDYKALCH